MAPRMLQAGTISFGLVNIPIKLYTAASSQNVSFHLIHAKCGSRIKQQQTCPVCNMVLTRDDLVRGYESAKNQYVLFTEAELEALEQAASKNIDIVEFVPLPKVDPVFFEKSYFLGPDKGGEKPYRLLAEAMAKANRVALAKFVMRGKENLVLIRPAQDGLMLHIMYFADEIRDFGEIDKGSAALKENELGLATRLIDELSVEEFKPEQYHDEYRERVLDVVNQKAAGQEISTGEVTSRPAEVVDLMEALKASLAKGPAREKKPAVKARRAEALPPSRKANALRK
ncbi:MAG TPA: Ku protein [Nitrospirales bacterium]